MTSMPASLPTSQAAEEERYSGQLWTLCPPGLRYDYCLSQAQAVELRLRAKEDRAFLDKRWTDEHAKRIEAEDRATANDAANTRSTVVGIAVSVGCAAVGAMAGALVDKAVKR